MRVQEFIDDPTHFAFNRDAPVFGPGSRSRRVEHARTLVRWTKFTSARGNDGCCDRRGLLAFGSLRTPPANRSHGCALARGDHHHLVDIDPAYQFSRLDAR